MAGGNEAYAELLAKASAEAGRGDLAAAIQACQKAVGLQPKRPEAWYNRGILRRMRGEFAAALDDLSAAVRLAPDRLSYAVEWQNTLTGLPPGRLAGPVAAAATRLLEAGLIDLQDCAPHLAENAKRILGPILERNRGEWGRPAWDRVCDPFFLAYLGGVLNADPEIELFLGELRRRLAGALEQGRAVQGMWQILAAFVRQLDRGGHALSASAEERAMAVTLAAALPEMRGRAVGALYGLPDAPDGSDEGPLAVLLDTLARERAEEAALASSLPGLGSGAANAVSRIVRDQYEAFPYPRWRRPAPVLPGARLEEIGLVMPDRAGRPVRTVLVAGCGTGRQAVAALAAYDGAAVTAIDLSRASLGYAARQARAAGAGSVRFLHCDLLDAALLGQRFDVVECVGVLHHMEDPQAGLRALVSVLAPQGLVKIGLYSRAARRQLDPFRAALAALEGGMETRIRALRQAVLEGTVGTPDERARVLSSTDFYALQEAVDLLGHAHEREMDLAGIGTLLRDAGLSFRGFSLGDPRPEANFREVHGRPSRGAPLSDWDEVERCRPETFRGMYNFWASQ